MRCTLDSDCPGLLFCANRRQRHLWLKGTSREHSVTDYIAARFDRRMLKTLNVLQVLLGV
jgi:hypothetical protein